MNQLPHHSLGTARMAFSDQRNETPQRPWLFLKSLQTIAAENDLSPEIVSFCFDTARIELPQTQFEDQWSADHEELAILFLALTSAGLNGSTCLPCRSTEEGLKPFLMQLAEAVPEVWKQLGLEPASLHALILHKLESSLYSSKMIGTKSLQALFIWDSAEKTLASSRMSAIEESLARRFERLLTSFEASEAAVPEEILQSPTKLNAAQRTAVQLAARNRLVIISGGPGTGKTTIIIAILRALLAEKSTEDEKRQALGSIGLAAPTGKAANQMTETIRKHLARIGNEREDDQLLKATPPEAQTLHRFLGYSPFSESFQFHEKNPLPYDVVIVDESSMIDLFLMERLLQGLHPKAKLILLGDAGQLPSVDAGAILRDLVRATSGTSSDNRNSFTVTLTESMRMKESNPAGSHLARISNAIRDAQLHALTRGERQDDLPPSNGLSYQQEPSKLLRKGVELLNVDPTDEMVREFVSWRLQISIFNDPDINSDLHRPIYLHEGLIEQDSIEVVKRLMDWHSAWRILCATRIWSTGTLAVNETLHEIFRKKIDGPRDPYLHGEPIIVTQNDYSLNLFNGDQGIICMMKELDGIENPYAVFLQGDTPVVFPLASLKGRIELAWAITVHKSQGSEYENVALILPRKNVPLLTRELIYTGITRAKLSSVIIGKEAVFLDGCKRKNERFSGVAAKLLK